MKEMLQKYYKLLIVVAVIALVFLSPLRTYLNFARISAWIEDIRDQPGAGFIYGLVYLAGVILVLPGSAMTALAGVMFGFVKGSLIVIIASNIGCQITFLIARYLGRDFIQRFIKEDSFVDRTSTKMEKNGFMVMMYLRLLPIFPFNVINYASGLTPIKYRDYAIASFLGMLPGTLVYVYLAASAADIRNNPIGLMISIAILILFTIGVKYLSKRHGDALE